MSGSGTKKARAKRAVHEEPSEESLREIPPSDPETSIELGRGAEGLRRARAFSALLRPTRGRPKKGGAATGSSGRSVRLPDVVWDELERIAEAREVSAHALMREAIVRWVLDVREAADGKPRKRARRVA
jgi:hypothetical protein